MAESEPKKSMPSLKRVAGMDSHGRKLDDFGGFSSTVVKQAFSEGKPIVVTGTDQGKALGSESAVQHNLKSIMAVPLRIREKTLGVVYLDSHLAKGLFTEDDLELLSAISNHIAIFFEMSRMANVEVERKALEKDMALVATVQSFFLPKEDRFKIDKISLAGYYQPASSASGDWWWYQHIESSNQLTVLVGDVTGHGAASAMMTAATAGVLQVLAKSQQVGSIELILRKLNEEFLQVSQGNYSMTMGAIQVDYQKGTLRFMNAGGPMIYVMGADGKVSSVVVSGTPLGEVDFVLGVKALDLHPGDRICMFTDGVIEMVLPSGLMLKSKGFSKIFAQTRPMNLEEAREHIINELKKFRGGRALEDDITLVVLDYQG